MFLTFVPSPLSLLSLHQAKTKASPKSKSKPKAKASPKTGAAPRRAPNANTKASPRTTRPPKRAPLIVQFAPSMKRGVPIAQPPTARRTTVGPTRISQWQLWANKLRRSKNKPRPSPSPSTALARPATVYKGPATRAPVVQNAPTPVVQNAPTPAPTNTPEPTVAPSNSYQGVGGLLPVVGSATPAPSSSSNQALSANGAGIGAQSSLSPTLIGVIVGVIVLVLLLFAAAYAYVAKNSNKLEPYKVWDAWKAESDGKLADPGVEMNGVRTSFEGRRSSAGHLDNIYGTGREAPDFAPYVSSAPNGSRRLSAATGAPRSSFAAPGAGPRGSFAASPGPRASFAAGAKLAAVGGPRSSFAPGAGLASGTKARTITKL